ncbi:MAG: GNAT family N-acetyltransferase [Bryobacteraceae bacterium]
MFTRAFGSGGEIRLLEERHAQVAFEVVDRNRQHLREWLPWVDRTLAPEDVASFIRMALEQFSRNEGFHAGIWHEGALAGAIGIHRIDWDNRCTSIGYWIDAAYQGRGLVTQACRVVLDHLFCELALNRVEIRCGMGNTRSCAIPERLGFVREGIVRQGQVVAGRPIDLVVYGMLLEEWLRRK